MHRLHRAEFMTRFCKRRNSFFAKWVTEAKCLSETLDGSETLERNASHKSETLQSNQIFVYPYTGKHRDEFWSHTRSFHNTEFFHQAFWHFIINSTFCIGLVWRFTTSLLYAAWCIIMIYGKNCRFHVIQYYAYSNEAQIPEPPVLHTDNGCYGRFYR